MNLLAKLRHPAPMKSPSLPASFHLDDQTHVKASKDLTGFSYYEYKYLVSHENLTHVRALLEEFYGNSDPFPGGIVDSIYYDTRDRYYLAQCLNGEDTKSKFRIRGYGDGTYNQAHHKMKNLYGVSKFKARIKPVSITMECAPAWEDLWPKSLDDSNFDKIMYNSRAKGTLYPVVRIQYQRYRFRSYDDRITLDTNIQAFAPTNGLPTKCHHVTFDKHVLELKTSRLRPKLPFLGLAQLSQVSFSKFLIGLQQLM